MQLEKIKLRTYEDERGRLVALEELTDIPFSVKRVYYIFDTRSGARRGYHAHRKLEQVLICVHGQCMVLLDNGVEREEVLLNRPDEGLYVGPGMWREMHDFSQGSVLLVLASEIYDVTDYIWDYGEFLKAVENR